MAGVFQKLNLKGQAEILVLNAPESFEPEIATLAGVSVRRRMPKSGPLDFALVFAMEQAEVDSAAAALARLTEGDAIVWFAYPKGTSRRYRCSFNRDTGWRVLGENGFEPVRQVAIDEDWSALRFRRAEFIKSMIRSPERALSKTGRRKAAPPATGRRAKR